MEALILDIHQQALVAARPLLQRGFGEEWLPADGPLAEVYTDEQKATVEKYFTP